MNFTKRTVVLEKLLCVSFVLPVNVCCWPFAGWRRCQAERPHSPCDFQTPYTGNRWGRHRWRSRCWSSRPRARYTWAAPALAPQTVYCWRQTDGQVDNLLSPLYMLVFPQTPHTGFNDIISIIFSFLKLKWQKQEVRLFLIIIIILLNSFYWSIIMKLLNI